MRSRRQVVALMDLADQQFTALEHPINGDKAVIVGALQRDSQTTARSPCTPCPGHKATVQVQAVIGRQADTAAIAGLAHHALPRNIQQGLGAGGVQPRPFTHHHKQITGRSNPGPQIERAADIDAAAIAYQAISAAKDVNRRGSPRRDIDQRMFADPDRATMPDGIHVF